MASPIGFLLTVLALATSLRCPSVCAEEIPGQVVTEAFKCFDNKFIYNGCESAYRLTPSGSFNVPPEATNLYCNGPCLVETQLVLNCLDDAFGNFLFYNKATSQNVRNALRVGCSYTSQRGRPQASADHRARETSIQDCSCKVKSAKPTASKNASSCIIVFFFLLGVVFSSYKHHPKHIWFSSSFSQF